MINDILLKQIKKYNPQNINEIVNAMKEVLQDIILCGLAKTDFFKYVVFYGGTSLRIFRELPRFSEDLDFTLISENSSIDLDYYLEMAHNELESLGLSCDIYKKEKKVETSVASRYMRFKLIDLFSMTYPEYVDKIISNELLQIKVLVEEQVFDGGIYENKLLTFPSFCQVRTLNFESLFSSKLIAVLNRKWKNRIKGRDFYDYLFYISNGIKVNLLFLNNGLRKSGYLTDDESLSIEALKSRLVERFNEIDFDLAKEDVIPFVGKNDRFIESFNKDIFIATVDMIK